MDIRYLVSFMVLLTLLGTLAAIDENSNAVQRIGGAMCSIVSLVKSVMGAVFLGLIVIAAIVYAAGQVLGAETRSRANVWATAMFTGAVIGGLIFLIVPVFIDLLIFGQQGSMESCCTLEGEFVPEECLLPGGD